MNPISSIQNYREKYSVMNVPKNLVSEIVHFNLKRKITDKELEMVLDKRIEVLKEETKMWKEKNAVLEKELELFKVEQWQEWKEEVDKKEEEVKEAYERSEV